MRFPRGAALLLLAALGTALASPAAAHTRSRSDSWWRLDADGAEVRLRMSRLDLSRIPPGRIAPVASGDALGAHLAAQLTLRAGQTPCAIVEPPVARPAREGWLAWRWRVECPDGEVAEAREIESALLRDLAPSHLHFARVEDGQGEVIEALLAGGTRRMALGGGASPEPAAASTLADYVVLGVGHILSGWDHLAFVFALLLLAASWRELALLVTSFTLAHSITLGLAVLGYVRPDSGGVEALIGYSVALVAAENAWLMSGRGLVIPAALTAGLAALALAGAVGAASLPLTAAAGLGLFTACHFGLLARSANPGPLRAAVAFGFGLIHGFGFAGILAELELPASRLAPALLGFNVGVELGQLAVVALCWPALRWLAARSAPGHRLLAETASAAIAGLGVFWWVSRSI